MDILTLLAVLAGAVIGLVIGIPIGFVVARRIYKEGT